MKATTEKAFESYIESVLYAENSGWSILSDDVWDKKHAIFPKVIIEFLRTTQNKLMDEMYALLGEELHEKLINTLLKEREAKGTIQIIRHGFKFYGKTFKLAYFKPAHGLSPENKKLYEQNSLTVSRQIPCHPNDDSSIDMLLALNGIPIATIELKNPVTGQTWRNAIHQYKTDRDPNTPLFQFKKGTLVHFAIDPEEIYMTTRLRGEKTFFLPFNRGSNPGTVQCGAGNPQHPSGHRTGYFWEDILKKDSFMNIVGNYIFLESSEYSIDDGKGGRKKVTNETMIFPRFHQLDAVQKMVSTSKAEKAGNNYLIQHSAGSGKTNSISWLAHRLASLHTVTDKKVFDCVIVITDRKVLDKQLQDAIYQIEHAQGVVKAIDQDSKQLAEALVDGTKIVITTLQKFPFILKGLLHVAGAKDTDNPDAEAVKKVAEWQKMLANRTYAIIVDEAHSSQTGESARELKEILGAGTADGDEEKEQDWEDRLNQIMESRGRQTNLSFYAFTATPKGKTLEMFGRKGSSGKPEAFHTYSMRQAIEEKFILDVLKRYTTYKTYFNLLKTVSDDPAMPKKKAIKKLTKFLHLHPHNIEQKTEIIIEHFKEHVREKLGGRAKAMVVTGSRLQAVRYMLSFQRYLEEHKYPGIRPLVAFSGTVIDPESKAEYTEPGMNIDVITGKSISEAQLPEKFDSSDYQVLLVANKYQTGFDQPLLCAMYVDKRLDGVQAVQTLSRLNRMYQGKELPFVLDFVNKSEDIYLAFKPYYDMTELQEESDPNLLEILKHELDDMQIYHKSEVEAFARIFYIPPHLQKHSDHARMYKHIEPSVDRFKEQKDEDQATFYEKITAFVRYYSFISQIIPYSDSELEILYSFGRFLTPHLRIGTDISNPHPEKEVQLQFYRLEKTMSGAIDLSNGESEGIKSPTAVGTSKSKDEDNPLSEIINQLNEKFGTSFTDEDRLFFEQIKEKACSDERVKQTAHANSLDKFALGIQEIISSLMMQRLAENDSIVTRYMDDKEFQQTIYPILANDIYKSILEKKENINSLN